MPPGVNRQRGFHLGGTTTLAKRQTDGTAIHWTVRAGVGMVTLDGFSISYLMYNESRVRLVFVEGLWVLFSSAC